MLSELLRASGTELARRIRGGELSSRDAVTAHIDRITAVNGVLNAVIEDRFARALSEADAADQQLAAGEQDLPPFHGVPCTIKEVFALEGMHQTGGLAARRDFVATSDATGVARLRAAGAIPMGTTNVPELCMWLETDNRIYGRTNNPYDARYIAGGSSGGEGAIIAAGGSPFGFGSDIAGSIRLPAYFNGVFGHKPSAGLVPGSGQFPGATEPPLSGYLTSGPLARKAEDLMPLLQILAGPDDIDMGCRAMPVGDPSAVLMSGLPVLHVRGNGHVSVDEPLRAAQSRAADALTQLGAQVRSHRFPDFKRSFEIWSAMAHIANEVPFRTVLGDGTPLPLVRSWLGWLVRKTPHTFPALGLATVEVLPELMRARTEKVARAGEALREEVIAEIGEGVMLFPTYPKIVPKHGWALLNPFAAAYTAIINVLGLPSTHVPVGLDDRGLPLGIQVVAGPGRDHVSIAVAVALETALGGWTPPG